MYFEVYKSDFSIEKDTGWLFGSDVISMISGLVGQAILVWILSGEEYGLFVIALDTCFTVLVLLDSGLSARVTRDVGSLGRSADNLVRNVISLQLKIGTVLCIFTLVLLNNYWGITWVIGSLLMVIGIFSHITSMTYRGALRGIGLAKHEAASRVIERLGMTVSYAILAIMGLKNSEYYACAAGLCFLIGGAYSMLQWFRNKPAEMQNLEESMNWRSLIFPSLPFAVGFFLLTLNYRVPKLLLGNSGGYVEAGVFNIALIGFSAALALPNAIWQSAQPNFGKLHKEREISERFATFSRMRTIARNGVIIGLPLALIAGFYGFPIFFPDSVTEGGIGPFRILAFLILGWSSILLTSPDWGCVMGSENPIGYAISVGLFVSVQLIGSFIYEGNYDAEKAAICFSYGAITSSIVYLFCSALSEGFKTFFIGMFDYAIGIVYSVLVIWWAQTDIAIGIITCGAIGLVWHISSKKMQEFFGSNSHRGGPLAQKVET
jgi:O-antigen/teichoic acid export membrane protein